jgi:hypothetical protein
VLNDFSRQRVAVNVKQLRCLALISSGPRQRSLDKSRFKFSHCVFKPDSALKHFLNESFQSIFHSLITTTQRVEIFSPLDNVSGDACRPCLAKVSGLVSA